MKLAPGLEGRSVTLKQREAENKLSFKRKEPSRDDLGGGYESSVMTAGKLPTYYKSSRHDNEESKISQRPQLMAQLQSRA